MKLSITKLYKSDKDKNGNPLTTQDGRPYTRIAIQTKEYGSKWVSGFLGNWCSDWKVGMEVEADVYEKGEYLNFKRPDPIKKLEERVLALEERIETLEMGANLIGKAEFKKEADINEELQGIEPDEVPF